MCRSPFVGVRTQLGDVRSHAEGTENDGEFHMMDESHMLREVGTVLFLGVHEPVLAHWLGLNEAEKVGRCLQESWE